LLQGRFAVLLQLAEKAQVVELAEKNLELFDLDGAYSEFD